jgi:hypothetical protein
LDKILREKNQFKSQPHRLCDNSGGGAFSRWIDNWGTGGGADLWDRSGGGVNWGLAGGA